MGKYSLKKKEGLISEENAIKEVMRLLERYEIDIDALEDDMEKAMEQTIDNLVKCVMNGAFEIFEENGELKVKQILKNTTEKSTITELVFSECNGSHHKAMKDKGNKQSQMLSLMSSMCETNGGFAVIDKLKSSDLKNLEFLSMLFL